MGAQSRAARVKLIACDIDGVITVREAIAFILTAQGQLDSAFAPYLPEQ